MLNARPMRYTEQIILQKLDVKGRLLAATTLLDMVIRDVNMVNRMVESFMKGDYDFSGAGHS